MQWFYGQQEKNGTWFQIFQNKIFQKNKSKSVFFIKI